MSSAVAAEEVSKSFNYYCDVLGFISGQQGLPMWTE